MSELDNEREHYISTNDGILATPDSLDFEVDESMDDHELLLRHVAGHDHELYGLDCMLTEIEGV